MVFHTKSPPYERDTSVHFCIYLTADDFHLTSGHYIPVEKSLLQKEIFTFNQYFTKLCFL